MKNFILFAFFTIGAFVTNAQTIRYVNATANGTNDGLSWVNAYPSLQSALAVSVSSDQIWVAKGTYKPSAYPVGAVAASGGTLTNRDFTFHLVNGVKLYGGFAGTETTIGNRVAGNTTILSGDIGTVGTSTDNCYHVILSVNDDNTTIMDGFTITGGYSFYFSGAVDVTVETRGISQYNGAGMRNAYSSPTLTNLIYTANFANSGGGFYNTNSSPILKNVVISNNSNTGMYNEYSSPNLTNVIFENNQGGGMYNYVFSSPILNNVVFSRNFAVSNYLGGGMYNGFYCFPTLSNCIFWGNMLGNSITSAGADFYIATGSAGSPTITITNTVLQLPSANYTSASKNIITGTSVGNIYGQDPKFINAFSPAGNDGVFMTADDGLRLAQCSPAINTGTNTAGGVLDIIGNIRPYSGGTTDMGAYEYQAGGNPTVTVGATTNPTSCEAFNGRINFSTSNLDDGVYRLSYKNTRPNGSILILSGATVNVVGNAFFFDRFSAGTISEMAIAKDGCTIASSSSAVLTDPPKPTFAMGTSINPSTCSSTDGSISLTGLAINTNFSVSYRKDGGAAVSTTLSSDASGVLAITGLRAGSYASILVTLNACVSLPARQRSLPLPIVVREGLVPRVAMWVRFVRAIRLISIPW